MLARRARPDELEDCFDVRKEVFVVEQQVPLDLEMDGLDAHCSQFIVRDEQGYALGTARLRLTEDGLAKAERVAVRKQARGRGLGGALMQAIEDEAAQRGLFEVVLSAQVSAIAFYEARGYVAEGPLFDDAGIPHRKMRRPCEKVAP